MRRRTITATLCVLLTCGTTATAAERFALVIGNGAYEHVEPLTNPPRDVELITESLESVGFTVTLIIDASRRQMDDAAKQFALDLDDAGRNAVGVFYYAGHAVSYEGKNWLLPVNANITQGPDIEYESISSGKVLGLMENARNATDIMVLDSCRSAPFRGFSLSGTRSLTRGLVTMQAPAGSFIAYSTGPGQVAYDGTGNYSPFATAFATEIRTPNLSVGDMMIEVTRRVKESTKDLGATKQVPWTHSSLDARFAFHPVALEDRPTFTQTQPAADSTATETLVWQSIKDSTDPAEFEAYLAQYPDGNFAGIAAARVRRLSATGAEQQPKATTGVRFGSGDMSANFVVQNQAFRGIVNKTTGVYEQPDRMSHQQRQLAVGDTVRVTGRVENRFWYRLELSGGVIGYASIGTIDRL
jgi:uncharacterized caspase-like protein